MVKPKKYLGQHFLKDLKIAQKIVELLQSSAEIPVLEIGAGTGVLTQFLLHKPNPLYVIEIDKESISYLKEHFAVLAQENRLWEGDFLNLDLHSNFFSNIAIIGNFPYNISSQIFFKILQNRQQVAEVVCMLQKEVAERLASAPGSKDYGILSVLLQAYYEVKYHFTVPEHVFQPPPKVKSGVIRLQRNSVVKLSCDENLFFEVVKTAFNQRRKTLRNALQKFLKSESLKAESMLQKRAEQLSVSDFIFLTQKIQEQS
ncbi:MAG: 16S rRNA (adenine(1518)-N(6)/adenine(1519)-N(6))-dimethyltransferase RsmA [Raineya sp.]|nr:16S rRNA (adenine(1518)-N(6)/adenine(1519)-N(6))-dimethyltransferase RsmA [Raineya sp.]MDW8296931.1 16S rRNA (adenine(1518)-N(6)/adenine(1519)-N(6))-dimethyltransferase RsmA [Raineya sp.]